MDRFISSAWIGATWARCWKQAARNYAELKNLIVWAKDNGGMGAFYRSRHELIFAFKNGTGAHINSFELGQHGRYRTNVWQYRGVNTLKTGRLDELALHPTVKPVAMIADAIKDVSRRNALVLDLFGGSGFVRARSRRTSSVQPYVALAISCSAFGEQRDHRVVLDCRTPWSIRSAPRSLIASRTPSGPSNSPALLHAALARQEL